MNVECGRATLPPPTSAVAKSSKVPDRQFQPPQAVRDNVLGLRSETLQARGYFKLGADAGLSDGQWP